MSVGLYYKSLSYFGIGILSSLLLLGCQKFQEDLSPSRINLVQFIEQDPNFRLLAKALNETGWAQTLSGPENYTLFAPHDGVLEAMGIHSWEDLTEEEWERLLRYHTLEGNLALEILEGEIKESLLDNYYLQFTQEEDEIIVNGTGRLIAPNIQVSNGWVHVIDQVLTPSTFSVLEIAREQAEFTVFVRALEIAGLEDTLATDGPFTIFAPTDAAFQDYFASNDLTEEEWLASTDLETWVNYHLVGQEIHAEDISRGHYATFWEQELYTSIGLEETIWINGKAQLSMADIPARNGVVHGLSQVLVAPSRTFSERLTEFAENEAPEFSQLRGALAHVGLDMVLDEGESQYTLIAPTDAAFEAWYNLMNVSGYEEIDEQVLTTILSYHIAQGVVFSQDFRNGDTLETLLEDQLLTVDAENEKINGVTISEEFRNELTLNGPILGIHSVLIPPTE